MEFFSGMIVGGFLTIATSFMFGFYKKVERKDSLLAGLHGKEFEEQITMKDKGK